MMFARFAMISAFARARRSQPRTVLGGRPSWWAIGRVLPVCCGCERFPDGLDAVGSTRERSDRYEHVAAVAVSTASASWGHPVDAATKETY
jgi:hypothetical protein